mmetsp:Transcript_4330/g.8735  ORF Transcript_4330/g.8735 Transcript_4330/m.8735 type:complete len:205 (+) Transcript_4330:267-881(+)
MRASRTSSSSSSASDLSFLSSFFSSSLASLRTSTCSAQSSRAARVHLVPSPTRNVPISTSPCAAPGALSEGAETNTMMRLPRGIGQPVKVSAPVSAACMEVWTGTASSLARVKSTGRTRCLSLSSIALLSCRTSTCMLYLPFGSVSGYSYSASPEPMSCLFASYTIHSWASKGESYRSSYIGGRGSTLIASFSVCSKEYDSSSS